ncbi:MAG: chloride channel protein [Planctomycetota bacterium]
MSEAPEPAERSAISWRTLAPGVRRVLRFLGQPDERWEPLIALAVLVGVLSGTAAVGLRRAVHWLFQALAEHRTGAAALLLPALGALLGAAIVGLLFREPPGHGVPQVIRAVCRRGGGMRRRGILSHWLGSLVTVSAGGSAGLEGPIVYSGAAIGSTIGSFFGLNERRRSVLLACGVAGGISAIFNAPMTGMIFALEVVLVEWSALTIVPVIVCAVAATVLSRLLLGQAQSFLHAPFSMGVADLGLCVALGLVAGLVSTALSRLVDAVARASRRLPRGRYLAPLLCGLGVGAIGLGAPGAIGEGYDTARELISPTAASGGFLLLLGLSLAKLAATGLTLGSGAPGGFFAPCLVLGALVGAAFHRAAVEILPADVGVGAGGSYALVGMAGIVAGVMQAPLTGILLVMEVTGGYEVILPLMIVAVLSLLVARRADRYGVYTKELAAAGDLLRPGTDRRILAEIGLREALDTDATPITEAMSLADLVGVVKSSRRNHFPVVDPATGDLVGLLDISTVRELLFTPDLARVTLVGTVMDADPPTVPLDSTLAEAVAALEESGAWVLPVLDGRRFAGLLSKSTLFDHYRHELAVQAM